LLAVFDLTLARFRCWLIWVLLAALLLLIQFCLLSVLMHVNYTEIELRNRNGLALLRCDWDHGAGTPDLSILAQPFLSKELIILTFKLNCLVFILFGLLEKLDEGSLTLV
jgi:hypothetical protein